MKIDLRGASGRVHGSIAQAELLKLQKSGQFPDEPAWTCVFIITDKAKLVGEEVKGVGVMKDEELKLEEIEASHTLGG